MSSLTTFADCIWIAATPVRFAGAWFPHVMTVIRLQDDSLLLHSPCRRSDQLQSELRQLGAVSLVVAPNWFHDLYLAEYRRMYPDAVFWGPPMLRRLKPRIIDRTLDEGARPPWFDEMPHIALRGLLTFDECVFWHATTRTLIVADFLMNLKAEHDTPPFTKLAYRVSGIDGRLAVFPLLRWFGLRHRQSLKNAAARMVAWAPDRIVVAHGTPVTVEATSQLQAALSRL